jgi:hypothetical protein
MDQYRFFNSRPLLRNLGARILHTLTNICAKIAQKSPSSSCQRPLQLTVLDQIARFFILLSGAPAYWFTINASCDHAYQLSKWLGIDGDDYKKLLIAANFARYKGNAFCIAGMSGNPF